MSEPRIGRAEALALLTVAPLAELMARAHDARMRRHPRKEVSYVIDTNPNYTNVCDVDCSFCSFFRRASSREAYLQTPLEMATRIRRAQELGATTALIQGGHHPEVDWRYVEAMVQEVSRACPGIHLHPFSPSELVHVAKTSGLSLRGVLERLWALGIRTIPGGGAEILVDEVRRKISPKKLNASGWLECMREAHKIGFRTSATMTYGHVETDADVVDHLLALREVQDCTGGFYAFIPWSFKPGKSPLSRLVPHERMAGYYLRVIALSRIVLDNFPHIQASWFGEGVRAGQLALQAGADDFGGVLIEENVLRMARHSVATNVGAVRAMIAQAGFEPVQRTTLYERVNCEVDIERVDRPVVRQREVFIPIHLARGS